MELMSLWLLVLKVFPLFPEMELLLAIELVAPSTVLFVLSSIVIKFDILYYQTYLYTLQLLAALNTLHILQSPFLQPTHPCRIGLLRVGFLVFFADITHVSYPRCSASIAYLRCSVSYSEATFKRIGSFESFLVFIRHLFMNLRGMVFPTNPILHDL